MSTNDKKLLIEFSKAISIPLYNTDAIKWPIRSSHIISAINDIYATEYLNQLHELVECYDPDAWNNAFPNALVIWRMAHHIINGLEKARRTKEAIAEDCLTMIAIIQKLNNNEELLCDRHLKSSILDVQFLKNRGKLISDQLHIQKLIALSTLLWAYSEALYFQGREVCCEYHGPYHLDNEVAVIRDYSNFMPTELWDHEFLSTEVHKVRIVSFHTNDIEMTVDVFNNVNLSGSNFLKSCTGGVLYINDKLASAEEIDKLIAEFSNKLEKQLMCVNSLSSAELYRKYVTIFWYRKKKLAEYLNKDWAPPQRAYDIIASLDIKPSSKSNYRTAEGIHYLEKKYDYSEYIGE